MTVKPRLIPLTDPDEIESATSDDIYGIIGFQATDYNWYAYDWSVKRWRERRQADGASGGES